MKIASLKLKNFRGYKEELEIKFDDEKQVWYGFSELDQIEHSYSITIHKAQRK